MLDIDPSCPLGEGNGGGMGMGVISTLPLSSRQSAYGGEA